MVYSGKPSPGCCRCRARRIKCDTKRPACTQCLNAGRECSGYRDAAELMFRDETSTTIVKHHKWRKSRKLDTAVEDSSNFKNGVTCSHPAQNSVTRRARRLSSCRAECAQAEIQDAANHKRHCDPLNTFQLVDSVPEIAVNLLLTKYVLGTHYEFLAPQCQASAFKEPFRSAVQSVALARFAGDTKWPAVSEMAWNHYHKALVETRKTLRDPQKARSDEVIAAVLLLSSFETISSDIDASTKGWTKHIHGAYALLTMRGTDIFETELGKKMFMLVASSIRLDCLQRQTRIPETLQEIMFSMRENQDVSDPRYRIEDIVNDIINFRASITEGNITDPCDIIDIAEEIDDRARALASDLQHHDCLRYELVHKDDTNAYGEYFHRYSSPTAGLLWNSLRMIRILVNEIIVSQLSSSEQQLVANFSLLKSTPSATIAQMCLEICASVPETTCLNKGNDSSDRVAAVNFLIWPLFKVGSSVFASAALRDYALSQLVELGQKYQVPKALIAAEQLECGNYEENWMHVSHLF